MLKNIFSPVRLNTLELHNRVLMSSMHLNVEGENQYERMAKFYVLRAKNGPGLIVTAGCSPDVVGRASLNGFSIDSDELIHKHRKITDAVHSVGDSKIALQLLHFGRESFHGRLVAPSALRLPGSMFTPKSMTADEIIETVSNYGRAAGRAVEAGYDAIELLFSQGFLIHQFLSPHTNLRKDDWGGGLDARMRFALQVAASVRRVVGYDYPIIFRIPCMDLLREGLTFEDSMKLVQALSHYQIDLLNISIGWHESEVPTLANVVPQAGFASTAARVKHRFPNLLCCVSNRINDLRHGEELLIEGVADMVAMARPFLADREIVAKAAEHRFDEVNYCIACNQDCLDNLFLGREVGCSVNPECASWEDWHDVEEQPLEARIAVVGGGLAGMSAAYHLARRGAKVIVFERLARLGGQMVLAAQMIGKGEFASTVNYLEGRLRKNGVEVLLEREFTEIDSRDSSWSHVVIATGTEPNFSANSRSSYVQPQFSGIAQTDRVAVIGWRDLLDNCLPVTFPVVIYGGGGVACEIAKFLLHKPDRVTVADQYLRKFRAEELVGEIGKLTRAERSITIAHRSSKKIGYKLGRTTRWIMINELEAGGVKMLRGAVLDSVLDEGVVVDMRGKKRILPARTLIMATGQQPKTQVLREWLEQNGIPFSVIGAADSVKAEPASISSSIKSGYLCGKMMKNSNLRLNNAD